MKLRHRRGQPDAKRATRDQPPRFLGKNRAAADADDTSRSQQRVSNGGGFQFAKSLLTDSAEEFGDGPAGREFDNFVGVDERKSEPRCEGAADG